MSQFRVEKRRAEAQVTLSTGVTLRGSFFLAASTPTQVGPERVADLLNAEAGFFPFAPSGGSAEDTVCVNRAHVIAVKLLERAPEAKVDPGYEVATERHVVMLLSNGTRLTGSVRAYCPKGHDRLSDYVRSPETFRYVECAGTTFIVNTAHIVEVKETQSGVGVGAPQEPSAASEGTE
jgi:hypothetical protein